MQLATINPDGYPHLVTMYYTLVDGKIAFWTYRTSQKALNLARDPRISCLVETGDGVLRPARRPDPGHCRDDHRPGAVYQLGLAIGEVMGNATARVTAVPAGTAAPAGTANADSQAINEYVANAARKRYGYIVQPVRVISWDHAKLLG